MAKRITWVVLLAAGIFVTGYSYYAAQRLLCSGLSDCYRSWRHFSEGGSTLDHSRLLAITQFSASGERVAFPAPIDTDTVGLVVAGNDGRDRRILLEKGVSFLYPSFSQDASRLLIVRRTRTQRELLSCLVDNWHCTIFLQTRETLHSPIEVDKDTILYGSSPMTIGIDKKPRYATNDFYVVRRNAEPQRLTDFKLYQLGPISLGGDLVLFAAYDGARDGPLLPKQSAMDPTRSDVYSLPFDRQTQTIPRRDGQLTPRFMIDGGYSVQPTISRDGKRAAFLNTIRRGKYRYDLVVADIDGSHMFRKELEGIGFSPAAFVNDTLFANELFENHYRIRRYDPMLNVIAEIQLPHAPAELMALEKISLHIQTERVADRPAQSR